MKSKTHRLRAMLGEPDDSVGQPGRAEAEEISVESDPREARIRSVESIARTMSIINRHPMHVKGGFAEGTEAWKNA